MSASTAFAELHAARRRRAPLAEVLELERRYQEAEIAESRIRHAHRSGTSAGRIDRQAGHQAVGDSHAGRARRRRLAGKASRLPTDR